MSKSTARTTWRSLQWCRAQGWLAEHLEHRKGPVTVDVFGFDVVAVKPGGIAVFVQATDHHNQAAHKKRLRTNGAAESLAAGPNRVELHVWKRWPPGSRVWTLARYDWNGAKIED